MDTHLAKKPSAGPGLRFDRLTMEHGLSQNSVTCILQDGSGFIWLGTQDGLNRYDGNTCRVYRHEAGNPLTLSSSYIQSLYEDSAGVLWVGTLSDGLSRYDKTRDVFESFPLWTLQTGRRRLAAPQELGIRAISEYPQHVLWLACDKGLLRVNSLTGEYHSVDFGEERDQPELNRLRPRCLCDLPGLNGLLAGTEYGLWFVDAANLQTHKVELELKEHSNFLDDMWIADLLIYDQNSVWVCTHHRILKLELPTLRLTSTQIDLKPLRGLNGLAMSDADTLWISSLLGLTRITISTQQSEHFVSESGNLNSLPNNICSACLVDQAGSLWCCTRSGVAIAHLAPRGLQLYDQYVLNNLGLASTYLIAFAEDQYGHLWIGSGNGLYRLEYLSGLVSRVGNSGRNQLISQIVLTLCFDQDVDGQGRLWVGTQFGVDIVNTKTYAIENFIGRSRSAEKDNYRLNHRVLSVIFRARNGDIYFGCKAKGLNVKRATKDAIASYRCHVDDSNSLGDDRILSIAEDQFGQIWVGTMNGLNCLNVTTGKFTRYLQGENSVIEVAASGENQQLTLAVLDICNDSRGFLWCATSKGLLLLINVPAESGRIARFKLFTHYDGLPRALLNDIVEDEEGALWISSNGGLIRLRYTQDKLQLRVYDRSDNAQDDEYILHSCLRRNDGSLIFGGPGGFNLVQPAELRDNLYVPPIAFTDFKVFNRSVKIRTAGGGSDRFQLDAHINAVRRLRLSYRESVFSIEFVALNFIKPQRNHYAYKLEGFDADWIDAGSRNFATYTNLNAGDYVFRVKAANNHGKWNEQGASLEITITPPPWKSWWAYSAYASAGFAGILAFTRARVAEQTRAIAAQNAIERAKVEERETMRRKNAADFHDEAGNKLTKIMLYTELVKRNAANPAKVKELMDKIELNAGGLSSGMRDFIWVLDPARDTLSDTIARLQDFGGNLFQDVPIEFAVDVDQLQIHGEKLALELRREILLIFKECMHNTLKHSNCKHALLSVRLHRSILSIALVDDGRGFDPASIKPGGGGYGLGNMRARASKISAYFALQSSPDQGTAVAISLKLPQMGD